MTATAERQPDQTPSDVQAGFITSPEDLARKVQEWRAAGCHVLAPAIKVRAFAPNYAVNASLVQLSTDPAAGELYCDPTVMKDHERAPSKLGLLKVSQAAGLTIVPQYSRRTDDRTIQHYWEFATVFAYLAYDGTPQLLQGTVEVDLRDDSAQIGGWTPEKWRALVKKNGEILDRDRHAKVKWGINGWSEARVLQARRFGLRSAESKSMTAAIRNLGLKQKYSLDELAKPFICLRVSFLPDYDQPGMRELVAAHALDGAAALYAPSARAALPAGGEVVSIADRMTAMPETIDGTLATSLQPATPAPVVAPSAATPRSTTPPLQTPAPSAAPEPTTSAPVAVDPDAVLITNVEKKKSGRGDRGPWTLSHVHDNHGRKYSTFDNALVALAREAMQDGSPVHLESEPDKYGLKLTNLVIGDRRQQALPMEPTAAPSAAEVFKL